MSELDEQKRSSDILERMQGTMQGIYRSLSIVTSLLVFIILKWMLFPNFSFFSWRLPRVVAYFFLGGYSRGAKPSEAAAHLAGVVP